MTMITLLEMIKAFFNIPIVKYTTITVYIILLILCMLAVIHDFYEKGCK